MHSSARSLRRLARPLLVAGHLLAVGIPLGAQDLNFPKLPADAPAGAGATVTCHAPQLHGTARCGVFRVLADRSQRPSPEARTIDIAFVILEALAPEERLDDAIILLPGGPGQAFTSSAVLNSNRYADTLRHRRDILLVDVRGVGRSAPLSCAVPFPRGFASRFGALFPLDHAAACRDTLSHRVVLENYTTASTVDDLEELRKWLGYSAFNLLGTSYGTRVAQVYLRRHPDAARTVVLNGVTPIFEPLYVQHAFLLQRSLDRLIEECGANTECHAAYPQLRADFTRLLARVREEGVDVVVRGTPVRFGAGDLAYALRGLLYSRGAEVPRIIHESATGDLTPLAEYYAQRTDDFSAPNGNAGYHYSVLCAEDIDPVTDSLVTRATRGTFMGSHLIDNYRAVCRLWPHARMPAAHWQPVKSDVPALLLSGSRDPVTPAEGADAVAAHLSNSVHVVVPNGGHGVGGECVQRMIAHLITTGGIRNIDTTCVQTVPPTRFLLPR